MYPILLKLGKINIYTYGFFIALGFFAGIFLAKKEAKRVGENPEMIMDLSFYILLSAIIGSRLLYVMTDPGFFFSNPIEIFKIWNGGLVFYGGFIAALIVSIFYLKKRKIPIWKTADIFAPSLAIGHFFGRIGCFSAGCCYGKASDLPWAVTFTDPNTLAKPIGVPLHPTQLYSALNNLIIFGILWFFRTRKRVDGQLFWLYVFIYGITRSLIEIFRGDFRGGIIFGIFSISQAIGCAMAIIAFVMIIFFARQADKRKTF